MQLSASGGAPISGWGDLRMVFEDLIRAHQHQGALFSVFPNALERQGVQSSASHSVTKRQIALLSAPGSVNKRVMEAPGSATLESSCIESLRGREESPLPLFSKNLNCPEPPRLPWEDSHKGQETTSPSNQPTRLSGQTFTSLHSGQGGHG